MLFNQYVKVIPTPSCYIKPAQYADDTALVATSKQSALLVRYLETRLTNMEIWFQDWRIAINVRKSAAILFMPRYSLPPHSLRYLGEEIQWAEKV
jgi:Reverse transcriptase (RNA-dependent DNA polymerase).